MDALYTFVVLNAEDVVRWSLIIGSIVVTLGLLVIYNLIYHIDRARTFERQYDNAKRSLQRVEDELHASRITLGDIEDRNYALKDQIDRCRETFADYVKANESPPFGMVPAAATVGEKVPDICLRAARYVFTWSPFRTSTVLETLTPRAALSDGVVQEHVIDWATASLLKGIEKDIRWNLKAFYRTSPEKGCFDT